MAKDHTIWLRHAFDATARRKGLRASVETLGEVHAFGIAEVDAHQAPVVLTVVRRDPLAGAPLQRGRRDNDVQTIPFRLHEGGYLRPLFATDAVTPLRAEALATAETAADLIGDGRWVDDPAHWMGSVPPGRGMPVSHYVEVDKAAQARARADTSAKVATLRVVDGVIWAPTHLPSWTCDDTRDGPRLGIHVPGLDDRRVARLADVALTVAHGSGYEEGVTATLPWWVPPEMAARALGAEGIREGGLRIEGDRERVAPDPGSDAHRAFRLAMGVDMEVRDADWHRFDPVVRMLLANVSGICRLTAAGRGDPSEALRSAAEDLAACSARWAEVGSEEAWPAVHRLLERTDRWVAARKAEEVLTAERDARFAVEATLVDEEMSGLTLSP